MHQIVITYLYLIINLIVTFKLDHILFIILILVYNLLNLMNLVHVLSLFLSTIFMNDIYEIFKYYFL